MGSLVPWRLNWKPHLSFSLRAPPGGSNSGEMHDIWRWRDGTAVLLRAARAEDGPLLQELVQGLSLQSRYHRFFYPLHELPPDMLARFTQHDPTEAMTLLALIRQDDHASAIAMAQYVAEPYPQRCDFAVVVADAWQGAGLGRHLIRTLMCIARAAGIERIEGDILAENTTMLRLISRMGFTLAGHEDGPYLRKATKTLEVPEWKCSPLTQLAARNVHVPRQAQLSR
ncbi:MAG TPA: GNAT family N-acetyltransferase [Noviherbaspirillum sp.]|nr:GNAT family N-acetyltransferase [Noviherbaspirillum sp.]